MRYRAVLIGVEGLERPVQQMSNDNIVLQKWADKIKSQYKSNKGASIEFYETTETFLYKIEI